MQKLKFLRNYPMDLGLMLKIIAAGILGGVIAVILVQIALQHGVIYPDEQFAMYESVGLMVIPPAILAAALALYYRKHE